MGEGGGGDHEHNTPTPVQGVVMVIHSHAGWVSERVKQTDRQTYEKDRQTDR